ncbi:MAG: deoxyribodipyrimidine photo-lyase [Opitutaceae bacterium]
MTPALVWFRQDLRLRDNAALAAAAERGGPVIPVFILDDEAEGGWAPGAASRWWLHHSLAALGAALREEGSRLILARGSSMRVLARLSRETGAGAVYWNRRYEPRVIARDRAIEASLGATGIDAQSFNSALLFEPQTVANKQGGPFQVFTPYWRSCLERPVAAPVPLRKNAFSARVASWPASLGVAALGLLPKGGGDSGLAEAWQPGERSAAARLERFISGSVEAYAETRDRPDLDGTSMLSARLHFGELGPRQVWAAVKALSADSGVFPLNAGAEALLREIGWREFAHHLLFHFPSTPESPLRPEFDRFPWERDPGKALQKAWREGCTGYPVVDAGMRQLRQTGWMHNRVRMIAASFLVKHLRVSWVEGAKWFWNTLVDADLANNTLGWQWSAGCGADAAPYFRIFAPVRQGVRSDPEGEYVRRWVPELSRLPAAFIHAPWEAPPSALEAAGVRLGSTYPRPMVDHAQARAAALDAFKSLRRNSDA